MATIYQTPNRRDEVMQEGVGNLGAGLGAFLVQTIRSKKLNEKRTEVESQIHNAGSFQDALTAIENAPHEVRDNFEEDLLNTAKLRFPEQELVSVLDKEGNLRSITQEKGRPLTDEQISSQGLERARQFALVSTDSKGNLEVLDSSIGEKGAQEDLARYQEMFPDRTFQIAKGPEIDTFMKIADQQNERKRIKASQNSSEYHPSAELIKLMANVQQTVANDPLATETGATVLADQRDDILKRFEQFNGSFKGDIFSLQDPDSATLVQNGTNIASTAVARGLSVEKSTNLGFNNQLLGRIVKDLSGGQSQIGTDLSAEIQKRFKVNAESLKAAADQAGNSPQFNSLTEFNPADPSILSVPVGNVVIQFVKVNGILVPYGVRNN